MRSSLGQWSEVARKLDAAEWRFDAKKRNTDVAWDLVVEETLPVRQAGDHRANEEEKGARFGKRPLHRQANPGRQAVLRAS
jgi:hypothetical protein